MQCAVQAAILAPRFNFALDRKITALDSSRYEGLLSRARAGASRAESAGSRAVIAEDVAGCATCRISLLQTLKMRLLTRVWTVNRRSGWLYARAALQPKRGTIRTKPRSQPDIFHKASLETVWAEVMASPKLLRTVHE